MKRLLLPLFTVLLLPINVVADEQRSLKREAVDLVINKHDKELKRRLEGTDKNPAYMAWVDDACNVSIKAGTHQYQAGTFSTMEWFDVNVCTKTVKKVCLLRGGCE